MQKKYDVAIIGGGVIGSSIAYNMVKRGMKVILLEKGRIAGEASSAAAGMLAAQAEMEQDGPLFELARKSRSMFPELASELRELCGIDIGLERKGMLKVALSSEQASELRRIIEFQCKAGEKAEWLSGEEIRRREPGVSDVVLGAMFIPDDGHVIAPELSLAFAKSAAVLGAEIREFTEVDSLIFEKGKVTGLQTPDGTIHCDHVVAAAGAWSNQLLQKSGLTLPVYSVKGECFSVLTHAPLIRSAIFSHGCYLVPKRGGRTIVGATMKERCYDRKVTVEGISGLMEKAKRLVPGIAEAELERAWCGLRPQTEDGLPYLGEHPDWKGLYIAAGHFRNGILLSAVTGKLAADWAEGNMTEDISTAAFGLNRHLQDTEKRQGGKWNEAAN